MKFLSLFFFLLPGLIASAQTDKKIDIPYKEASGIQLIELMQKETPLVFSFDDSVARRLDVKLSVQKTPATVNDVLDWIYHSLRINYKQVGNAIVLTLLPAERKKQPGVIRGRIVDFETAQPLPGATVTLQETGRSVLANEKGYYEFSNVPDTQYTLMVSYVGYEKNTLPGVSARTGTETVVDIKMQAGSSMSEVVVKAGTRKVKAVTHATEKDLLAEIRNETGVVSGISNELISKTADRNAAEVMKRVSGVTVVDNRFVVVRGMNERYNLTYLNDNLAPSTELYNRAFAYDLLPSSIIDRILVYKSPRADLNGQFAGAAIKVYTKNAMPVRHFDIGVQLAHRPGSTLTEVNTYSGGKLDWLGVDDGTRKLPSWSPGVFQTTRTAANVSQADMVKGFSSTLDYGQSRSTPDMQAYANYYNAWRLGGRVRLYDLTSVTYTKETTNYDQARQTGNTDAYQTNSASTAGVDLGANNRIGDYEQTTQIGKENVLENLTLKLGSHNTLQFKNFFVNDGRVFNGINDSRLNTAPYYDTTFGLARYKDIALSFQQRTLYSGNLGGSHTWSKTHPQYLEWNLGYTHDLQNVPDQRISHFESTPILNNNSAYEPAGLIYTAMGSNTADYDDAFYGMISRLFVKNRENVYNFSADYTYQLGGDVQLKAGTFQLFKTRQVGRRFFRVNRAGLGPDEFTDPNSNASTNDGYVQGYGVNNPNILTFRLQDLGTIWNPANFPQDGTGLWIYDATSPVDGYSATEQNNAGYVMGDWKTADEKLTINAGLRLEYDRQKLAGATEDPVGSGLTLVYVDHAKTSVLPSVNLSFRPDSAFVIRAGYGRTVDRPEFRELTPYDDFDFINNEEIIGNPSVVSSTIDNYDLRAEFYPRSAAQNEVLDIGVFYKHLQDPIERLRLSQDGLTDFSSLTAIDFANAQSAEVYGLEAEAKKSLSFLGGGLFRRLSVVVNGALIKSTTRQYQANIGGIIDTGKVIQGRPLQGQAPYVFNGGLFYEDAGLGTKIGLTYNVAGPTIYAKSLGNPNNKQIDPLDAMSIRPDLLLLPMHLVDLSITQRIIKSLQMKFSIQNLLDQPYRIAEDRNYDEHYQPEYPVKNVLGQTYYVGDDLYEKYKPGRYFLVAFTYAF